MNLPNSLPGKRHLLLRSQAGVTVLEVAVAMAFLATIIVGSTHALLFSNRQAATARLATAARAIVQRNIDNALDVSFRTTAVPPVLVTTSTGGATYDDDGGGDNVVKIAMQENQTTVHTTGTLTRIVTAMANTDGADIRNVTFRLAYQFRGRNYTTEMTTQRSLDD